MVVPAHAPPAPRRRDALGVEALGDLEAAAALRDLAEDAPEHLGLGREDLARHVAVPADVAIAVDDAARYVAALGLPAQGIPRALAGLLALHVVDKRNGGHHELVHRGLAADLRIAEVAPHLDAGIGDALQGVGHFVERAAEPALVHDHEHVEGGPGLQSRITAGVHQRDEPRALQELRAGDPVVGVDVRVGDGPALARGVGAGALELARDGLLLVGDVCWSVDLRA